ncbi:MAG: ArsR family transcriptional regulator [Pseudonocardiaceae bacterium]|nr:MAG: ArsR family transcriptional regulator [Pseudonocardiaceae bacterium]
MSTATLGNARFDAIFAALADPTRRAIVERLAAGDATVTELAAPFDMTQPAVSKHIKVLEASGLITRSRRAQFRPCHLEVGALESTIGWMTAQRRVWNDRFDRLDEHLAALRATEAEQHDRTDD